MMNMFEPDTAVHFSSRTTAKSGHARIYETDFLFTYLIDLAPMARRKKSSKKTKKDAPQTERKPWFDDLSPHARQAITAVLIGVLGIFFAAALFDYAGMVGTYVASALRWLFGVGAYLSPIVCFGYMVTFLKPNLDDSISGSKIVGIALIFVSALGLLELSTEGRGGGIGWVLQAPLEYLVGQILAGVVLGAVLVIGIVLLLNTGLRLSRFNSPARDEVNRNDDIEQLRVPTDMSDDALGTDTPSTTSPQDEETTDTEPSAEKPTKQKTQESPTRSKKTEPEFRVTNFSGPYDPPPLSLLGKDKGKAKTGDVKANANIIKQTLKEFGINVEMDTVEIGPTVTRYALKPAQGVKISRIVGLQRELELNLASGTLRIEAPIPGKSLVGIEVPNSTKATIGLSSLLADPEYTDSPKPLLVALGKDITGNAHFANIARMPHSLIAGTTGSGKSVVIHNLVVSLLFRNSPEQLRFLMVDPKRVELTLYDGIPHLLTPVITDAKKTLNSLKWAVKEMERRYDILQAEKLQNLEAYHEKVYRPARDAWVEAGSNEEEREQLPESLPYIVVIIDELADLMHAYPRELEALVVRLAQMSRAVGIHLILATQRPSVNVITGTIKANIPTRLALQVASQVDSRTILDQVGAERLLGKGDMLYLSGELAKPTRLQSAFIANDELTRVVDYLKNQDAAYSLDSVNFDEEGDAAGNDAFFSSMVDDDDEDELYSEAKQAVIEANKASTSFLQRKLRIGYSRAARLVDALEERGIIGPADGAKPREIIVSRDTSEEDEGDEENDTHAPHTQEESDRTT
jgi:S-DNA-T family DNA segregation ATPase FtsK/SpoIIIE